MKVVKRTGNIVDFNFNKIKTVVNNVIKKNKIKVNNKDLRKLFIDVKKDITKKTKNKKQLTTDEIFAFLLKNLKANKMLNVAKIIFEDNHVRDQYRANNLKVFKDIGAVVDVNDKDNANVGNNFAAKLLRIASISNKYHMLNKVIPKEFAQAHINGDIYIHDLDSYNLTINCLQLPTGKLLQNGFNCSYGYISTPRSIETAAELSCIMLQASQNDMFGGQGHPDFDNDLAPYVAATYQKIVSELKQTKISKQLLIKLAIKKLIERVNQAMQAVVYNLNTMHSRGGGQVPFSSLNIGLPNSKEAAMVCQSFLEQYLKGLGYGEQPIFPNIIFRVKKGVNANPGDPYYYLFQLACHVASQRMNPTFMNIDADFNNEYYQKGYVPATMGCRTYIMSNVNGEPGVSARGNIAPVTINIVRLAILAKRNIKLFYKLFDEKIDLCYRQLKHRYQVLSKLKCSDLPFVGMQKIYVGSENLKPDDSIEPILKQGTWSIGFIGLAETLKLLTGYHHGEDPNSEKLGIEIISHLREKLDHYKQTDKLNFTCYATPAEGLSNKFTIADEKIFGPIEWITTKGFYTNSFHIPVDYPISYFQKIKLEAPFHKICNAGHISYVEFDAYPSGKQIEKILTWAYEHTNINYLGFNFHMRYCLDCIENNHKHKLD